MREAHVTEASVVPPKHILRSEQRYSTGWIIRETDGKRQLTLRGRDNYVHWIAAFKVFSKTEALFTLPHKLDNELIDKLPNTPFVPTMAALKIRSYPHTIALYHYCGLFYILVLLNLNRDFVRLPAVTKEEKRNFFSPSSYFSSI
jgi:hypothetical protein